MLCESVGDGGHKAYTAIVRGELLNCEICDDAEAEAVGEAEGNMCDTAMRGADALPQSETLSRTKGTRRNLGDLAPDRAVSCCPARIGKVRSRSR